MKRERVRVLLAEAADSKYKEFNDKITNCQAAPSLGVRVPDIRKIAKQIVADGWEAYLEEMEALGNLAMASSGNSGNAAAPRNGCAEIGLPLWQEEHMLQGIVIGCAKMLDQQRIQHLDLWIPGVLSWADCDCSVSSFKFMKKNQAFWFDYLSKWLYSGREFEVRVALVALMQYFINEEYIDRVLEIFARDYRGPASFPAGTPESGDSGVGTPGKSTQVSFSAGVPYYIRMAQAWALSVCFVKFTDKTWDIFARRNMEPWVQNKAIQKCRESYRVSREDKELLLSLRM